MTAEVVGGVDVAPPTVASRGRTARLRELAPFLPAGLRVFLHLLLELRGVPARLVALGELDVRRFGVAQG